MKNDSVTLKDIYDAINSLREEISENYVTKQEFWPVKSIVYGGAGIVLTAVLSAILVLIMKIKI
jgi:hypothetical protein